MFLRHLVRTPTMEGDMHVLEPMEFHADTTELVRMLSRGHHDVKLTAAERLQSIIESTKEVARPVVFGMGIILVVFIPVLTLQGIEGKMFRPMAWTFIFAMLGALVVTITLTPILFEKLAVNGGLLRTGGVNAFGRWSGTLNAGGQTIEFKDMMGWAEEFEHRW